MDRAGTEDVRKVIDVLAFGDSDGVEPVRA